MGKPQYGALLIVAQEQECEIEDCAERTNQRLGGDGTRWHAICEAHQPEFNHAARRSRYGPRP
jgi:hypothetical protein